jgi:hypothetical protein
MSGACRSSTPRRQIRSAGSRGRPARGALRFSLPAVSHTVRRALLTHGVRPPFARYCETIARAIADIESDHKKSRSARTVSPSNRLKNRRLKAIQHEPGQPQNNPGYTTNEWGQSSAHRTKDIGFSTLYAAIIGFGTQGSQVRILPLRPFFQVLIVSMFFVRNEMRNDLRHGSHAHRS